jgi:hypothetical protein
VSASPPVTIIETPEFIATIDKLLHEDDRAALIDYLAYNPMAGAVVAGTGGVRKLRWGLEGRGKRGGARVIYFYHSTDLPLFILTAYAKNERDNLTQADKNGFKLVTKLLADNYGRTKR